jgi:molybdopterin/thiamine biosynthesis adenylyltransferase
MSDQQFMRQLDILPPDLLKKEAVTIVGCGGIGSSVSLFLAKMGIPKFILYDADIIQTHNISNQMFPRDSINKRKVDAVADEIIRMSPMSRTTVEKHFSRFDRDSDVESRIIISCLDSMESRKDVWHAVKWSYSVDLYIDARMGGEVAKVYAIRPMREDSAFYEPSLKQGDHHVACTASSIAYNVAMIAAIVGSNVRRFLTDLTVPRLMIGDSLNLQFIRMGGDS